MFNKLTDELNEKFLSALEKIPIELYLPLSVIGIIPGITLSVLPFLYKKYLKKDPKADLFLEEIALKSMVSGVIICIVVLPSLIIYSSYK